MTPLDRRSTFSRVVAGAVAVVFFVMFVSLGTWQVKRRAWKLDLIARVEQRVRAPAGTIPDPQRWSRITAAGDEYRHVALEGTFLDSSQTLVQAVTDLGPGYWVLTPLRMADDRIVLVNRGFVPADARDRVAPGSRARITGLIRMSEPGGAFLRHNDPIGNRWYSRDVQAICAARGIASPAPFFVDADAAQAGTGALAAEGGATPIGGLTVIRFHNSHLVYAITWYTLALMSAGAVWLAIRNETRT